MDRSRTQQCPLVNTESQNKEKYRGEHFPAPCLRECGIRGTMECNTHGPEQTRFSIHCPEYQYWLRRYRVGEKKVRNSSELPIT